MQGRDFVVPDDVKTHGPAVLRHRLILQPDAEIEGVTTDEIVHAVLHETQVPGMGEGGRRTIPPQGRERDAASSQGHAGWAQPTNSEETMLDARPAPSAPARPANAPHGSGASRPAGLDPDTIPPVGPGPIRGK